MGLLYAFVAILAWGLGDFLIQKSARKFGDWEALFFICLFGAVILAPFAYGALATLSPFGWFILSLTSIVILIAALFDFEALRVGKISVIEPIYAMEIPVTVALATFLIGEHLRIEQFVLIATLLVGVYLVANKKITISLFPRLMAVCALSNP